ncbi:MAG: aspartate ammonia-lyase [Clostridia bacterium]|nr:aspartate ammonia-lyase [Clostridia bacterium]MDN5321740.1 aspartate ammonia-lyase [Clostridia bacterium]
MRTEKDFLGEKLLPTDVYWGIHTQRAVDNFPLSGQKVHQQLIKALVLVKISAAQANMELGFLSENKGYAIMEAGAEILAGKFLDQFPLDALQGGAGTSTNMNVNEVLANRATELLGGSKGQYLVNPLDDVNMHQSTNDVYPTALRIAAIQLLLPLSESMAYLQDSLQEKEAEFAGIIKPGRTQLQDALPITLGQEFSAYAQAVSRDRWRIFKVEERLRQVNLGGTAVGTGINAPREYIYLVIEKLRQNTGIGLARAENMIDITQNTDVFVEVSGLLKAAAVNLNKIASDLRLLSSGPITGLAEIQLPEMQAGSSIMPGKVNPIIPEAVNHVTFQVMAADLAITLACHNGQLELNAFLPLVAHNLLNAIELLTHGAQILAEKCIKGIKANYAHCQELVEKSLIMAPVLVPHLGYQKTAEVIKLAREKNIPVRQAVKELKMLTENEIEKILDYRELARPGIAGKGGDSNAGNS